MTEGKIDDIMERASDALAATSYFEAERLALKALHMAREESNFERMSRIVLPLQEARRQRYELALSHGGVNFIDEPVTEEIVVDPGCYLIQPMQVGADARRLRLAAWHQDVPVAVICIEPETELGLWPIVAVTPGTTVRTRIDPPKRKSKPSMKWFVGAMEALGDQAIDDVDPTMPPVRRMDAFMDRLDAVPEHEKLHQALEAVCREAAKEQAELMAKRAARA